MPYCSSEGKLAGYEECEVEIQSENVNENTAEFEVHMFRPCSSCGTESAIYDTSLEVDIEHQCKCECADPSTSTSHAEDCHLFGEEPEYTISSCEASADDYMQTHSRTGKLLTGPMRYRKHLFAAVVTAQIECSLCSETFDVTAEERDIAASYFEAEAH